MVAFATGAGAAINFTMSGSVNSTALGYTSGQSIEISFVTTETISTTASSEFTEEENLWIAVDGDPDIWSDVISTAFLGSFATPEENSEQALVTAGPGLFPAVINTNLGSIGLQTLDGTEIWAIELEIPDVTEFTYAISFVQPTTYFQDFLGEYTNLADATGSINTSNGSVSFTINSLTISNAAVPEPSTTAALAGAAALAFAFSRRRFR